MSPTDMQRELDHLTKTGRALAEITGRKPVGTSSDHTLSLLKQEQFIYTSHDSADHLPYYVTDAAGDATLLNLPFH